MLCRTKKRSQNYSAKLTNLQKQVYSLIKKIPKGRISTYGQIAKVLGRPNSARLIGRILSQNPYLTTSEFQKYIRNSYIRRRFVIRRKNIARSRVVEPRFTTRRSAYVLKIPCHRVVKSDGQIGGYKLGVRKKEQLLKKEGVKIKRGKIFPPTVCSRGASVSGGDPPPTKGEARSPRSTQLRSREARRARVGAGQGRLAENFNRTLFKF